MLCLDRRHAGSATAPHPNVVLFDKHVDAAALVAACTTELARFERVARTAQGSSSPAASSHWLTLSQSPGLARYAALAGARPEHCREDVLAELSVDGIVRIGVRSAGCLLVGERLAAEVVADGSRPDALFVHRIVNAVDLRLDAEHRLRATLKLRRPGEASAVAEPVAALLARGLAGNGMTKVVEYGHASRDGGS